MKLTDSIRQKLNDAIEARSGLVADLEAIPAAAELEARSITDAEQTAFDAKIDAVKAADADIDSLRARLADLEAIEARNVAASIAPTRAPKMSDPFDFSDLRGRPFTRDELRSRVDAALECTAGIDGTAKERVADLVRRVDSKNGDLARRILITGSEAYRSAFAKLIEGDQHGLTDVERAAVSESRAASLTDAAGGFAVPFTLDPTIIDTGTGSVNPMRQLATIKTTVGDQWAGVSSAGVTASWDAEGAEVSDDAPTLAQPNIAVHKAQVFVPFSIEVGMDWANMESDVRMMFATARDDLEATAHFTGSGSGQPTGIVTALDGGSSEVAPTTAEAFAVADLYKLEEELAARYRARASWAANKAIYNDVRQFGTADSHALWERLGAGQPAALLGYPAYEASAMDNGFNAAATADNFILILGAFEYYYIVDRIGLTVDLVPHLFHTSNNRPSGQRGLYGFWRTGGDSVNDAAFRMLNVATTA